jgi:anaerobic selenocysteine-containing dehydrogenase
MTLNTTCPMDCPDACALGVEVEDGRVVRIGGRLDHPNTSGFICSKVANFGRRQEHADRLVEPLRRVGGKGEGRFEAISWDAALAEITRHFESIREQFGGEAIVPFHYGGSNGMLTDGLLDGLFFHRLGASRLELTICAVPTTEVARGMYGRMPGVAFEDFPHARFIVIWGANPKASNIHLVPYLREAKRNGAFIASVDPRRNFSAGEADLHLGVRPGTDLPVALAMIQLWRREGSLDEAFLDRHAVDAEPLLTAASDWSTARAAAVAGVEAAQIELLARTYAEAEPALLRCGWGLERNRNGGQAVAAVLAMPTLLGKFGKRGAGYLMSNGSAKRFDKTLILGDLEESDRRSLNMTQLGRWLNGETTPPVKALFVYNANPVATVPNQNAVIEGLRRPDLFTVVSEQIMTDTARYADIVLPATTFLEGWDLKAGYGSYVLGGAPPVVEPTGEARTNQRLFADLASSMGFTDEPFSWTEEELLTRAAEATDLNGKPVSADRLLAGDIGSFDFPGPSPIQFETVHPWTADGKVHLTPAVLGPEPFAFASPEDDFPLALISPASSRLISSTFGETNCPILLLDIHSVDAAARGIQTGDAVTVRNKLGVVECTANVTNRIRPGVVSMPKGAWQKASRNGATSVALCPDHVNVVGGAACFNDARVEVERA